MKFKASIEKKQIFLKTTIDHSNYICKYAKHKSKKSYEYFKITIISVFLKSGCSIVTVPQHLLSSFLNIACGFPASLFIPWSLVCGHPHLSFIYYSGTVTNQFSLASPQRHSNILNFCLMSHPSVNFPVFQLCTMHPTFHVFLGDH